MKEKEKRKKQTKNQNQEETNHTGEAPNKKKQQEDVSEAIYKRDFVCESLEDTRKTAAHFAKLSYPGVCFALYGTLGSGKTTFSQFLIKTLIPSVRDVSSPTFTIVQTYEGISEDRKYEYENGDNNSDNDSASSQALPHFFTTTSTHSRPLEIRHVDCYRIENPEDFYELGLEETWNDCITIIEWPEIIEDFLPPNTIKLQFKILEGNVMVISEK